MQKTDSSRFYTYIRKFILGNLQEKILTTHDVVTI
nr:MAG TPA: hypothetical protein [Ackermannviridae sp.]DAW82319.1 MAG TPA: hypothetical protein [Bacteriophage sp.]